MPLVKVQRIAHPLAPIPLRPHAANIRLSSSLLGGGPQAVKDFQHRWGQIRVVMRHLPHSSFSLINVRHPNLPGDFLSAHFELWTLNADFVGDIAENADELVL